METEKQDLVRQPSALTTSQRTSLTASEKTLAVEMRLTAQNSKTEPDSDLLAEFIRKLADEPVGAIQWAFDQWRETSPFWPAISDIKNLLTIWHRRKIEELEIAQRKAEREEINQSRSEGKLLGWADVLKKFSRIVDRETVTKLADKKMPEPHAEIVINPDRREMIRQQAEAVKAKYGSETV